MRCFILLLLCLLIYNSAAMADETLFNSTIAWKEEARRLGDEAGDFLATPSDTDNYGMFGTLAVIGATGLTYAFDGDIRGNVQSLRGKTLDRAADIGSLVGSPFLHIGIAGAFYGGGILADSPRYRETGLMLGEALLLADASTLVLKEAIGRERPFVGGEKGRFSPFQFKQDSDSLPSLHTASSFAMASVLAAGSKSLSAKILYYSAAAFVGFARIYQDKHWASDVVLGAAIGELSGRVVTRYHASRGGMTFAPLVSEKGAGLALVGRW